jgi:hypothetical protein
MVRVKLRRRILNISVLQHGVHRLTNYDYLHIAEPSREASSRSAGPKNSPRFKEAKCSLPGSQKPVTANYPEPLQFSSHFHIILQLL